MRTLLLGQRCKPTILACKIKEETQLNEFSSTPAWQYETNPLTYSGFVTFNLVGMTGFEPATSHSRSERSTKLSHIPVLQMQRGI